MINCSTALPAEIQQLRIGRNLCAGIDLFDRKRSERRRLQNPAQDLQAFDVGGAIDFAGEIVDAYFRRLCRVGTPDAKRTAALGAKLADRSREAGKRMQLFSHLVGREWREGGLGIRGGEGGVGFEKRA